MHLLCRGVHRLHRLRDMQSRQMLAVSFTGTP